MLMILFFAVIFNKPSFHNFSVKIKSNHLINLTKVQYQIFILI